MPVAAVAVAGAAALRRQFLFLFLFRVRQWQRRLQRLFHILRLRLPPLVY